MLISLLLGLLDQCFTVFLYAQEKEVASSLASYIHTSLVSLLIAIFSLKGKEKIEFAGKAP